MALPSTAHVLRLGGKRFSVTMEAAADIGDEGDVHPIPDQSNLAALAALEAKEEREVKVCRTPMTQVKICRTPMILPMILATLAAKEEREAKAVPISTVMVVMLKQGPKFARAKP